MSAQLVLVAGKISMNQKMRFFKAYQKELDFWIEEEGLSEEEADNICYEV